MGVVSRRKSCVRKNSPGIYTRVKKYLNWIKNITRTKGQCYNKNDPGLWSEETDYPKEPEYPEEPKEPEEPVVQRVDALENQVQLIKNTIKKINKKVNTLINK